ncbi:MAG TPA: M48 family metalloprotease [Candidatus Babeliales bacterium]|nr:M48 family metalloprotease [Candidatus Babeliales bacterium]
MLNTAHHPLKQILSTVLLTASIVSWADQPNDLTAANTAQLTTTTQIAEVSAPITADQPTTETATAITALTSSNLLELDEVAGEAFMQQMRAEISALQIYFNSTQATNPAISAAVINKKSGWCPTLYQLLDAITAKANVTPFTTVTIGCKADIAYGLQINGSLLELLQGSKLLIGAEIPKFLNYQELFALLLHEMGHLAAGPANINTLQNIELAIGTAQFATIIAWARHNQAYNSPTFWGNIKNHFKFMFTKKGFAVGASLGLTCALLKKYLERRAEYAADKFANQLIGRPEALISALEKYTAVLEAQCPHLMAVEQAAAKVGLNHHPTVDQRTTYLQELQAADLAALAAA